MHFCKTNRSHSESIYCESQGCIIWLLEHEWDCLDGGKYKSPVCPQAVKKELQNNKNAIK